MLNSLLLWGLVGKAIEYILPQSRARTTWKDSYCGVVCGLIWVLLRCLYNDSAVCPEDWKSTPTWWRWTRSRSLPDNKNIIQFCVKRAVMRWLPLFWGETADMQLGSFWYFVGGGGRHHSQISVVIFWATWFVGKGCSENFPTKNPIKLCWVPHGQIIGASPDPPPSLTSSKSDPSFDPVWYTELCDWSIILLLSVVQYIMLQYIDNTNRQILSA